MHLRNYHYPHHDGHLILRSKCIITRDNSFVLETAMQHFPDDAANATTATTMTTTATTTSTLLPSPLSLSFLPFSFRCSSGASYLILGIGIVASAAVSVQLPHNSVVIAGRTATVTTAVATVETAAAATAAKTAAAPDAHWATTTSSSTASSSTESGPISRPDRRPPP